MEVYTYFDQDPALADFKPVLETWQQSWRKHGWNPLFLTPADARKHPLYMQVESFVRKLPTVNPLRYEVSNYMRWLAMDVVRGGLHVDSDVINYGLVPPTPEEVFTESTILDQGGVPCAVWCMPNNGFAGKFLKITKADYSAVNGCVHMSDMIWFQWSGMPCIDIVREPDTDNQYWRKSPLNHFSSGALARFGFNKGNFVEAVKSIRPI